MTMREDATGEGNVGTPRPVRLALLDDHEVLLDALGSWIGANAPDFELVLSTTSWLDLVHSEKFPTDLVILDFPIDEPVSIEARVRTCRAAGARVIVLSSLDSAESRDRAGAAGAVSFLSKTLPMREVMAAARAAMGVTPDPAQRDWRPRPAGATARIKPNLSAGEALAFTLYTSGLSTPEVALRMNVQYETAKTYLRRVREKYSKVDRPAGKKTELIRRAAEDGFLR